MSEEEMKNIEELIKKAECKEAYPFNFDVAQYKLDFSTLRAFLEEALEKVEELKYAKEVIAEKKSACSLIKIAFISRYAGYAESVAVVTLIFTAVSSAVR